MPATIEDVAQRLEEAVKKAGLVADRLRSDVSTDDVKAIRGEYETLKGQITELLAEKTRVEEAAKAAAKDSEAAQEMKRMRDELDTLLGNTRSGRKHQWETGQPGAQSEPSLAGLIYRARKKMDLGAMEELAQWNTKAVKAFELEGKAIGEGTSAAGGYLVPPQYYQDLVALRRASAPLRQFLTTIPGIKSNQFFIPVQTGVEQVAWTAENAPKISTDETFGQVGVNVFTLAGIAKVSNQLLEDSTPAVDAIVKASLGKGLAIEEDRAFINGTGTGQPTGILNTAGITATGASAGTAAAIFDDILAAIGRLQAAYFGMPDAILMAPRTWSKMQTAKDSTGRYITTGTIVGAQQMNMPGVPNPTGSAPGPTWSFMGIPMIVDANMPINQGGSNSSIIVGAFAEAWIFERDGIRMDMSSEAGTSFEQNQTWFRGEERVGFTAGRYPTAFQIVTGETA